MTDFDCRKAHVPKGFVLCQQCGGLLKTAGIALGASSEATVAALQRVAQVGTDQCCCWLWVGQPNIPTVFNTSRHVPEFSHMKESPLCCRYLPGDKTIR